MFNEHNTYFLFIFSLFVAPNVSPIKLKSKCNISITQSYQRSRYYNLLIKLETSLEDSYSSMTFLQLCIKPASRLFNKLLPVKENSCRSLKRDFFGIGHPIDIGTGKLVGAYIKEMLQWGYTNLEIEKVDYLSVSKPHISMKLSFWYSPVIHGEYICVAYTLETTHALKTIAESNVAELAAIDKNVILSIRHAQSGFIIGDFVYFVCDYKQGSKSQEESIKVEYANEMLTGNVLDAEVTPDSFEFEYKRRAAVFQILTPSKGLVWYFLNPTMTVRCLRSDVTSVDEDSQKIKISFVPFDPIVYLNKSKGNIKRADSFNGVQVLKVGENAYEQQVADRLKRNSLRVGHAISCSFKGDPKPNINWTMPNGLRQYVSIITSMIVLKYDHSLRNQDKLMEFRINCSASNYINGIRRTETIRLIFYFLLEGHTSGNGVSYQVISFIIFNTVAILGLYLWTQMLRDVREANFAPARVSKVPSHMLSKSSSRKMRSRLL